MTIGGAAISTSAVRWVPNANPTWPQRSLWPAVSVEDGMARAQKPPDEIERTCW